MGDTAFSDRPARQIGTRLVRPFVSSHAIVRYCQCVLNIHLAAADEVTEWELARIHLAAAGASRKEIVAAILTPAVCAAIRSGFTQFGNTRFVAFVSETGTVKTIAPPFPKHRKKLRIMSRVEARARQHRLERRSRLSGDPA